MRNLGRSFSFIILLHVIGLSGCCHNPQRQVDWHRQMKSLSQMATGLLEKNEVLITESQLIALLGEPDFVVTPDELKKLMVAKPSYKEKVLSDLYVEDFKDRAFWLYDESEHFDKPFDHCCRGCAQVGFTCWVFILKDSKIIASHPIAFWVKAN